MQRLLSFLRFYRAPGRPGGYTLSKEELAAKIDETVAAGGIQILLQGGLNPELGIEYYEDLFRWLKRQYPAVNLHALSADEILHVGKVSSLSIEESLSRLIAAGMGSLPGAGAEILVDHVRKRIARLKCGAEKWLAVHRTAHRLGIPSTCTMMFGVKETWHDRLLHLEMLRQLQDETGGFTAFITWPYQQGELKLVRGNTSAAEYLRVQALARLFLDNIPHLQSSWVTQGPSIGQIARELRGRRFRGRDVRGERGFRRRHHLPHEQPFHRVADPPGGLYALAEECAISGGGVSHDDASNLGSDE